MDTTTIGWAVLLLADLWAIYHVATADAPAPLRAIWIGAIVLLPVVGFVAWCLYGPKARARRS